MSVTSTVAAATPTPSPTPLSQAAAAAAEGLTWDAAREWFLDTPLAILMIIALAVVCRWLLHRAINGMVRGLVARKESGTDTGRIGVVDPVATDSLPVVQRSARKAARALTQAGLVDTERQRQRVTTIGSVMRSIASVVIWTIAALMIGEQLGLNMAPVLASAGVGGVALGFGAQSLVKDFLSGMFMILEDQYGVGDIIDTGEAVGTVEEVTLRVTRLRDMQGVVWYVRNGEIVRVANKSQGWQVGMVDVPVAIDEDPERVIEILKKVAVQVDEDPTWSAHLLEEPTVAGVESIAGGTMTIRMFVKCPPNQHWGVQRELRERAKVALAAAGVRGPILAPALFAPHDAPHRAGGATTGDASAPKTP